MTLLKFGILLLAGFLLLGCVEQPPVINPTATPTATPFASDSASMKSFTSWTELSDFIGDQSSGGYSRTESGFIGAAFPAVSAVGGIGAKDSSVTQSPDYSATNVQVEGVDEADIVKTNGKNIFVVTQGKVVILDAYPAENMKVLSEIKPENGQVSDIFIEGSKLVVFGTEQETFHPLETAVRCAYGRCPTYYSSSFLKVYDVTNPASLKVLKTVSLKGGNYVESRLIDGKVYALFNEYAYRDYPMPLYTVDGLTREIAPSDVKYFDYPDYNYAFNIFVSVDLNDLSKQEQREIILMGSSNTVFVSKENIYTAYTMYNYQPQIPWVVYDEVVGSILPSDVMTKINAVDASDLSDWRKERMKISIAVDFVSDLSAEQRTRIYNDLQNALERIEQNNYAENTVVHK
ncbi:MAG: beta-propeller domain-containing protein, partial [Candidatus Micrarchaeota archaeon]